MRVFKTKSFARFTRKKRIQDDLLCEAVNRAERGLIDADLGDGLIKQRIPRPNEGRSGGYRAMLAYQSETITIFMHGFAKNEQDNVSEEDLIGLRKLVSDMLSWDDKEVAEALENEFWMEIEYDG